MGEKYSDGDPEAKETEGANVLLARESTARSVYHFGYHIFCDY
jgi:hypothetical protein